MNHRLRYQDIRLRLGIHCIFQLMLDICLNDLEYNHSQNQLNPQRLHQIHLDNRPSLDNHYSFLIRLSIGPIYHQFHHHQYLGRYRLSLLHQQNQDNRPTLSGHSSTLSGTPSLSRSPEPNESGQPSVSKIPLNVSG